MYFPFLRGKQEELIALRESAPRFVENSLIIPIIEPVRVSDTTRISFDKFVEENLRFMLITNPVVSNQINEDEVYEKIIQDSLEDYDNFIPTLYTDATTSLSTIRNFEKKYEGLPLAFIYQNEPQNDDLKEHLPQLKTAQFHVFLEKRTSVDFQNTFPQSKRVLIQDRFNRRERNADYEESVDEFFSDLHLEIPNEHYSSFGDFSIIGDHYFERAGRPYAVALHHVYIHEAKKGSLHVRHFVSKRKQTFTDVPGKFLEALDKLVQCLPRLQQLNRLNHTSMCDEYAHLYAEKQYRGLGYAVRMALKHHFELMLHLLEM